MSNLNFKTMFTASHKKEKFNSCNAWGFAGGIGDKFVFSETLYAKVGKAYYRHLPPDRYRDDLPPDRFITVYRDDVRIIDRAYSEKALGEVNEAINKILGEG